MKNKNLETLMYSAGGIIALALILVAANFIFSALNARVDLTEGRVYTLSEGTRSILAKLEAPVKIRLYYSQGSTAVPPGLKTFASRVEDVLNEFKAASNGKVIIEKFNPEPDSDAEESAALDNVEGQMTNTGEKFYLGLSVSFLDQKAAIPVLTPDRERLLEYDITRSISQVGQAKKPVIGIMSNLPVLPMAEVVSSYYLRLRVADQAGVLAQAGILLGRREQPRRADEGQRVVLQRWIPQRRHQALFFLRRIYRRLHL